MAFSPRSEALLHEAKRISIKLESALLLIHAGKKTSELEKKMNGLLKRVGLISDEVQIIWKEGSPVKVMNEVCLKENVDLLVLGAMQHENFYNYYIGSIARKISRNPPCSLLLVIHPNRAESNLNSVVVNGINHPKTEDTIETAVRFASSFKTSSLLIVEEVPPKNVKTKIDDDETLKLANIEKERVKAIEDKRIQDILKKIDYSVNMHIETKCVFGKVGYSIGHFAEVKKADLLVMNSPDKKLGFLDRFFPHDLEYLLTDLPCDLMIVQPKQKSKHE